MEISYLQLYLICTDKGIVLCAGTLTVEEWVIKVLLDAKKMSWMARGLVSASCLTSHDRNFSDSFAKRIRNKKKSAINQHRFAISYIVV